MAGVTERRPLPLPVAWQRGAVGAALLFVALELLTRAELVTPAYLPPASSILAETVGLLGDGGFWSALRATLESCLLGLLRALVVGVPLGMVLGLSRLAYRGTITVVELLRPLPSVALIPLLIPVMGRGADLKIFLVSYACLWPILFNTIYGMHSVDRVAVDTARAFGLGRLQTALRVQFRASAPFVFTGLKIAVSISLIVAVSAEIVAGGAEGLGIEQQTARELGDLKESYAYVIAAGTVGLILHLVFETIERRLFAWNLVGQES